MVLPSSLYYSRAGGEWGTGETANKASLDFAGVIRYFTRMKKKRLVVGVYHNDPAATTLRFVRCLRNWNLSFVSVWRDELASLKPGDVDVLLLHGGWYGINRIPGQDQYVVQTKPEYKPLAQAVKRFVRAGGGIVGVCAGAFNVVWLGLIKADISRSQGAGPHAMEVVAAGHPLLAGVTDPTPERKDRHWKPIPVIRINGPIFFPKNRKHLIASYDWEQRLGAVLAAPYGKGRAVAISPHPEFSANESLNGPLLEEPLMRVSGLLKNALYWSAGRDVPA